MAFVGVAVRPAGISSVLVQPYVLESPCPQEVCGLRVFSGPSAQKKEKVLLQNLHGSFVSIHEGRQGRSRNGKGCDRKRGQGRGNVHRSGLDVTSSWIPPLPSVWMQQGKTPRAEEGANLSKTCSGPGPGGGGGANTSRVSSRSLMTSLLVNYSVLMSDWWVLKSKARERASGLLAHALPLATSSMSPIAASIGPVAGVVAETVGSVRGSLLQRPPSFLLGNLAPASPSNHVTDSKFPESGCPSELSGRGMDCADTSGSLLEDLEGFGDLSTPAGWYARGNGGARIAGTTGVGVGTRAQSTRLRHRLGCDSLLFSGVSTARASGEDVASVIADDLDPSVEWEQRKKDVEAEASRQPMASPGFSYSAAGLLFPYHLGVSQCLMDNGYLKEDTPLAGSSAGAIVCGVIAAGLSMEQAMDATKKLSADCRANGTAFRLGAVLRKFMDDLIPDDAHIRASGRIRVAVTQLFQSPRGLLVDKFDSKEDLVNALITSSFIPGYLAPQPVTRFRDRYCIDGGVTLFMPPTASEETVRICAFPASSFGLSNIGISPDCNPVDRSSMRQLFSWALEPAEDDILDDLFRNGYEDTLVWVAERQAMEIAAKERSSLVIGL